MLFLTWSVYASDSEVDPSTLVKVNFSKLSSSEGRFLAITLKHADHWHTYWKNPGDAGLPTIFEFKADQKKLEIEGLEWPLPKTYYEQGNLLAYGYSGIQTYFFRWPKSLSNKKVDIKVKWLVCKNVCIPGQINQTIVMGEKPLAISNPFEISQQQLKANFARIPKVNESLSSQIEFFLTANDAKDGLILISKADKLFKTKGNWIYPFPTEPLSWKHEQLTTKSALTLSQIPADWDGQYSEPEIPFPKDGRFNRPLKIKLLVYDAGTDKIALVEKQFKSFSLAGTSGIKSLIGTKKKPLSQQSEPLTSKKAENVSLLTILFFAFLGGLILNIMPCVLPVISLKLFGLIKHSEESKKSILKHNLFYTLGIQIAFITLSIVVVLLKSSGQSIGWGFHLQNPYFVSAVLLVLFTMSLNFLGLFEFSTPGGRTLVNIDVKQGHLGDIFNGLLATLLSTPCSAPFLGTALTYAFTTTNLNVFIVFLSVGFGLVFPFILTGFFPGALKVLPRPGAWMDKFKKLMGLPLLLTTVWLYDVVLGQADNLILWLNISLVALFFAIYSAKHIFASLPGKAIGWVMFLIVLSQLFMTPVKRANTSVGATTGASSWSPWSEKAMQSSLGKWVFVDFTARWCFTCKVNKKVVIQTQGFEELMQKYQVKTMVADWTNYDPIIGDWLKKQGLAGVPAYFLQSPNGKLHSLGETLSLGEIQQVLNQGE